MANLTTIEVDNFGNILFVKAPENSELKEILPSLGESLLSYWDEATNSILKEYFRKVFSTPHAIELSVNLNFHIVDFTAYQYSDNKAFVHCKYIETLPQPKSLPPEIKNWGFEKNADAFQNNDKQIDHLGSRFLYSDIVENIGLGIIVINFFQDGSFFISYNNKEFQKIAPTYSGKIHNENNNHLFERIHPEDLVMVEDAVRQLFELKPFDIEIRMIDAGETKNIRLSAKPIYNKLGNFITAYVYFQDITEQIRNQQALKVSEEKYKYLFENTPYPMIIWEFETLNILDVNKKATELYGYTKEEFTQLNIKQIRPVEDIPLIEATTKNIESYGVDHHKVWRHLKKNGELMYMEISARVFELNGKLVSINHNQDVTQKRILEERLKMVDFGFRNISMSMFFIGEEGHFIDYNEATNKMLGYTHEEFSKLTLFDINPNFNKETWAIRWQNILSKPNQRAFSSLRKKDGTMIDVEINVNIINIQDVNICCAFYTDITEKKKAEERLKMIDFSFNNVAIPIIYLQKDGSIYDCNKAFCALNRLKKEEIVPYTVFDFGWNYTKQSFNEYWERVKEKGSFIYQDKRSRKDGTLMDIEINPNFIQFGETELICTFTSDITKKKKTEERLKLSDYIIKNATTAIYLILSDGSIYDFNEAAHTMLGYTKEEFAMLHQKDIDPTLNTKTIAAGWVILKRDGKLSHTHKLLKKDATPVEVEILANFIEYNGLELNCAFVTDITEKKKGEFNLRLFEYSFKNSGMAKIFITKEGHLFFHNKMAANLLGYTFEEFDKLTIADLIVEPSDNYWAQRWEEYKKLRHHSFERKLKKKSHELIDTQIDVSFFSFEDIELVFISFGDITERKRVEERLLLLEKVVTETSQAVVISDATEGMDTPVIYANAAFTKITGYTFDEVKGNNPRILHRDMNTKDETGRVIMRNAIKDFVPWKVEVVNTKKNGEHYWAEVSGFPVFDKARDKYTHWIAIQIDISSRKNEEERLKLLESVIMNTKDSILITEAEPFDKPGPRIIFVNPAFTKMTGYTPEEVIGQTPRLLQNEETDRNELDKLRIAMKNWEAVEITVANTRKNGQKFWNNFSMTPVANEKGWFTHWIAVERDVTKEIEAALEKEKLLEELVQNNKELKQFSYITTHNLRAPLTNLISICNLLKTDNIEDERTVKLIEGFKISTHHLNDTLNDLIKIVIIKENVNLTKGELNFEEVYCNVKDSIYMKLINSVVTIEADFTEAPVITFSKPYLESIFLNLLTNSIKYAHPKRYPIIKIKTTKEKDGKTKLTFSDNGIGMNMNSVKDKIFGLYQRFHSNTDSKGIGLYLIHSQITALGGKIEVESEANVGTTFTITFK